MKDLLNASKHLWVKLDNIKTTLPQLNIVQLKMCFAYYQPREYDSSNPQDINIPHPLTQKAHI